RTMKGWICSMQEPRISKRSARLSKEFATPFWKGRKTNASLSRCETTSGAFCKSRRSWNPNFSESSDLSDATYLTALHDQTAHRLSHLRYRPLQILLIFLST